MENETEVFSSRLNELVGKKTGDQRRFAEKIGVSSTTLNKALKTAKMPSIDFIQKVAGGTGVSIDWLFGRTDIKELRNSNEDYKEYTYAEVFRMIADMCDIGAMHITVSSDTIEGTDTEGFSVGHDITTVSLVCDDYKLASFANDCEKIKATTLTNVSDDSLGRKMFSLWFEDMQKKNNTPVKINTEVGFRNYF